jgi:hypothetical protein
VTPIGKLIIDDSDEFAQIFPFHFFTLAMKVKPRIVNILILELLNHFTHFLAYSLLAAFLVNQVDKILTLILSIRLFEMLIGGIKTGFVVGINDDTWAPLHRGLHLPDEGYRATNLHVGSDRDGCSCLYLENVLLLSEVCSGSITVQSSCDKSTTRSTAVPSRD